MPEADKGTIDESGRAQLLDALSAEIAHQYQIAERLDAKIQRSITFTGAFFALVQAAAISSLLKSLERGDQYVLLGCALGALAAVGIAGLAVLRQERLQKVGELPLDDILDLITATWSDRPLPQEKQRDVGRELATMYAGMVADRRNVNRDRGRRYQTARWFCLLSVVLTSVELGYALIARLS